MQLWRLIVFTVKLSKTVNTRNIFGMFIVFVTKTNQIREGKPQPVTVIVFCGSVCVFFFLWLILPLIGHRTIGGLHNLTVISACFD